MLNHFFQGVFTIEGDGPLPIPPDYEFSEMLEDVLFTEQDTEAMLSKLNTDKAPGPDGLSPLILKRASSTLELPPCCIV